MKDLLVNTPWRPHVYPQIDGWFDFETLYAQMVQLAPRHGHFVEVGSFVGKSAAFMAIEIFNSKKEIRLDAVDVYDWRISLSGIASPYEDVEMVGEIFDRNMERFNLRNLVTKIRGYSSVASTWYEDESLDFVFLDADHSFDAVRNDIRCWLPKVKPGGYLGGHDYNDFESPGVIRAVHEEIGIAEISLWGEGNRSWLYKKKPRL